MKNPTLQEIDAKIHPLHTTQALETDPAEDAAYPLKISEAQGDLADRANIEIDQEIQEGILRARQKLTNPDPVDSEA